MAKVMRTTEILNEMLEIPGLNAIEIVGKDGFVIESAGSLGQMDKDAFGASVALVQNGVESMSREVGLTAFHTITLEAANAMVMCVPAGDALVVLFAQDSKTLGMIRLQAKKHIPELAKHL
ncbi:MAG: roadblock/LC7 domain-containing protein [Deltaproteobacteria bacterium]|nr:roadblock/LC7 domain-containing protein [Deltaproteobacteria bacterium]